MTATSVADNLLRCADQGAGDTGNLGITVGLAGCAPKTQMFRPGNTKSGLLTDGKPVRDGKKRFADTTLASSKVFSLCCTLDEAKALLEEMYSVLGMNTKGEQIARAVDVPADAKWPSLDASMGCGYAPRLLAMSQPEGPSFDVWPSQSRAVRASSKTLCRCQRNQQQPKGHDASSA